MHHRTTSQNTSRVQHYIVGLFALFAVAPAFVFLLDHPGIRVSALVANVSDAFSEDDNFVPEPCPEDEPPEACSTEDTGEGATQDEGLETEADEEASPEEGESTDTAEESMGETQEAEEVATASNDPVVKSLTVSNATTPIISGATTTISWEVENTKGVNLVFACNKAVIPFVVVGDEVMRAPCEVPAFTGVLKPTGSVSVIFSSNSKEIQTLALRLAPQGSDGNLHPVHGKLVSLSLAPVRFTRSLVPDLTHPEVRLLQEYLKKHPELYPEGKVTGIYGPATEAGVKRLQEKYGLGNPRTPGFGSVGVRTRALLNYLTSK